MSANNTVILVGRTTSDPSINYLQGDKPSCIAKFCLAVDRNDRNHTADFINVTCFGARGEFCEKYVKKGMKLVVRGSWQTGNYTNKDGQKVYTNECLVDEISFAESKNANNQNTAPSGNYKPDFGNPADYQSPMPSVPTQMSMEGFMNIPTTEDLPFGAVTR